MTEERIKQFDAELKEFRQKQMKEDYENRKAKKEATIELVEKFRKDFVAIHEHDTGYQYNYLLPKLLLDCFPNEADDLFTFFGNSISSGFASTYLSSLMNKRSENIPKVCWDILDDSTEKEWTFGFVKNITKNANEFSFKIHLKGSYNSLKVFDVSGQISEFVVSETEEGEIVREKYIADVLVKSGDIGLFSYRCKSYETENKHEVKYLKGFIDNIRDVNGFWTAFCGPLQNKKEEI